MELGIWLAGWDFQATIEVCLRAAHTPGSGLTRSACWAAACCLFTVMQPCRYNTAHLTKLKRCGEGCHASVTLLLCFMETLLHCWSWIARHCGCMSWSGCPPPHSCIAPLSTFAGSNAQSLPHLCTLHQPHAVLRSPLLVHTVPAQSAFCPCGWLL